MDSKPRLVLASGSPRRKALMGLISPDFEVIVPDIPESVDPHLSVPLAAEKLARLKAQAVADRLGPNPAFIISSDTMVFKDGLVLNKPADDLEAIEMLQELSGGEHRVTTAVAVFSSVTQPLLVSGNAVSVVRFRELSDDEITAYVRAESPLDKAGAYAIQEGASSFVESVEGSLDVIIGFPLLLVRSLLAQAGWKQPDR